MVSEGKLDMEDAVVVVFIDGPLEGTSKLYPSWGCADTVTQPVAHKKGDPISVHTYTIDWNGGFVPDSSGRPVYEAHQTDHHIAPFRHNFQYAADFGPGRFELNDITHDDDCDTLALVLDKMRDVCREHGVALEADYDGTLLTKGSAHAYIEW